MSDTLAEVPPTDVERLEEKLDRLLGGLDELRQAVVHLADNFGQFREHESKAIDSLGGRVKRLEHRVFDTEPSPAPEGAGNGAAPQ